MMPVGGSEDADRGWDGVLSGARRMILVSFSDERSREECESDERSREECESDERSREECDADERSREESESGWSSSLATQPT